MQDPTQRWSERKQRIVEVASIHINRFGPADVDLRRIALDCRLSRSTLYHYVKDRISLVEDCLEQSIAHMEWAVEWAVRNETATGGIEQFVRKALDQKGRFTCALSDIGFLGIQRSKPLSVRANAICYAIRSVVAKGVSSGEFSDCDPQIAADLLLGAINWTKVAAIWGSFADEEPVWESATTALVDLVLNGVAAEHDRVGLDEAAIPEVVTDSMFWKSAFDSEGRARARRDEICRVATAAFNERGIGATTIEDIAKELRVTIGAIYHSFPGKADLVYACYSRSYEIYANFIKFIEDASLCGIEQIYSLLLCHSYSQIGPWKTMRGQSGIEGLRTPHKTGIMARHRDIVSRSSQFYRNAMKDGTARGGDALLLSSAAAGAISWLPSHRALGEQDAQFTSRIAARQLLQGLSRRT